MAKTLDEDSLARLYLQLAQLQKAGLGPEQTLRQVQVTGAEEPIRRTLRHLQSGVGLAEAGRRAGLFKGFDAALLAASEQTGEPAFSHLAEFHAARAKRWRRLRSQMWLPMAVLLIALLVRPLPALVGGTMGFGGYLGITLLPFLLIILAGKALTFLPTRIGKGKWGVLWDAWMLRLPIIGRIARRRAMVELTRSLGLMLRAGLPIFEALPKAVETVGNRLMQHRFSRIMDALRDGLPFTEALRQVRGLDERLLAFVSTGAQAGSLEEMLLHYTRIEEENLELDEGELYRWLPRLFYLLVALWMSYGLLTGGVPSSLDAMPELR